MGKERRLWMKNEELIHENTRLREQLDANDAELNRARNETSKARAEKTQETLRAQKLEDVIIHHDQHTGTYREELQKAKMEIARKEVECRKLQGELQALGNQLTRMRAWNEDLSEHHNKCDFGSVIGRTVTRTFNQDEWVPAPPKTQAAQISELRQEIAELRRETSHKSQADDLEERVSEIERWLDRAPGNGE